MIDFGKTLRSFRYASEGMERFFRHENNARVHLLMAVVVVIVSLFCHLSATEWALIAVAIGGVWAAEIFNTAIEKLCDIVQPEQDVRIKYIKDLAAAGVFMVSLVAVCVGLFIFGTRFVSLFL